MKTTLTEVKRFTKDKDGNTLKTRDGRAYTRINIKTTTHNDKWISGFENQTTKNWQAGDDVEIEVKENGEYLNFSTPKMVIGGSFTEEDRQLLQMIHALLVKGQSKTEVRPDNYPEHGEEPPF